MNTLPLSVCLIARNEAHNLPGLVGSVRALAQEIVVVDTGSTDGTPALAQALGARVLHTPWRDDFAAARNVALAAARSEWILTLDADQQLDAGSHAALAAAVRRQDCLAQLVTIRLLGEPLADGREHVVQHLPSLRLVRRDPRIRYSGRVHEDVAQSLGAIGSSGWPDSGVTVTDHGYVQAEARRHKLARNLALLRRAHAEEPGSLHVAYKLAISLPPEAGDERTQVLEWALHQACLQPAARLREVACLPRLAAAALAQWAQAGRLEEAAEAARTLLARAGEPLAFTAGAALARAGCFTEARSALQAWLAAATRPETGQPALRLADDQAEPAEACWWLAWMANAEGDGPAARRWIEEGRRRAATPVHAGLEGLAVELELARGDTQAAARALEHLGTHLSHDPARLAQALPELMVASARVARACGDTPGAQAFALQAGQARHDAAAVLLAQLDIDAGRTDATTLQHHHEAIQGERFDTLAFKRMLGTHLGIGWPYPLPAATQALLAPPEDAAA